MVTKKKTIKSRAMVPKLFQYLGPSVSNENRFVYIFALKSFSNDINHWHYFLPLTLKNIDIVSIACAINIMSTKRCTTPGQDPPPLFFNTNCKSTKLCKWLFDMHCIRYLWWNRSYCTSDKMDTFACLSVCF